MDSSKIDRPNLIFTLKVVNTDNTNKICIACSNDNSQNLISFHSVVEYAIENQDLTEIELKSIFQWLISTEISFEDDLPNAMCSICVQNLLECFSFRLASLNSFLKLQEVKNNENSFKNIPNISFRSENEMLFLSNFDDEKQNMIIDSILGGTEITNISDIDKDYSEEVLCCDQPLTDKTIEDTKINIDISKRLICYICGKQFKNHTTLKKHSVRHSEKKLHQCKDCGKDFFQKGELSKHMITHNKKLNHVCELCGVKFSRSDTLAAHKKIHSNEKPYGCSFCSKRFLNSYNLQNHTRTHSKEKPFVCAHCSKGFTQRTSLIHHINTIHCDRKKTCNSQ